VLHPRLHVGVGVLVVVGLAAYLLLSRTRLGYEITFMGSNPTAAAQSGISTDKIYITVFVVGGLLAGLAGIIEVAGVHGRLFESFSPGYGFTAVAVALLGRNGVSRVFLAAFFFGILTAGGTTLAITQNVPSALIDVIVALTILFLLTAEFFKEYRLHRRVGRRTGAGGRPSGGVGVSLLAGTLESTVRLATPLLLAAMGEIVAERSGVLNLGVEGMMLAGALAGFAGAVLTGSLWVGFGLGVVAGMALALLHAVLCISLKADQVISGIMLTLLGIGLTTYFGRSFIGENIDGFARIAIPGLSELPIVGAAFFEITALDYLGLLLVPVVWFLLFRTNSRERNHRRR